MDPTQAPGGRAGTKNGPGRDKTPPPHSFVNKDQGAYPNLEKNPFLLLMVNSKYKNSNLHII
ncbi:hypothetical protein [Flavonifractor plautii]|uniref:hypothetical protein n=1 Tax=Flavonifractor plautii TaxID=292800 RepID=UPI00232D4B75|nr:hypothetical protein [Flavonifractor plautii]MDB7956814.1 hypothetical protein [Flavonifractor plautii]